MKTTRRLTAVTLVLLLLLSLCGCMTEEPTPSGQGGTTAVPTQVTTTASSASATTATDAQPTTAETTAVTTKVMISTETVPLAPNWTVTVQDEATWNGDIVGTPIKFGGQRSMYQMGAFDDLLKTVRGEQNRFQGRIVHSAEEYDALMWTKKDVSYPQVGMDVVAIRKCKIPVYNDSFFTESVLVEFLFENTVAPQYWYIVENVTKENNLLYVYITGVDIPGYSPHFVNGGVDRILIEMSRKDIAGIEELSLYVAKKELTKDECVEQYGPEFMRCCELHDNLS